MAEITDLDPADGASNARWPEGMAPSAINNSARALEGMLARWFADSNATITTGGSATAYTVTTSRTIAAYYDGLIVGFQAHATNTSSTPTLNANGIGAANLFGSGGRYLYPGAIAAGAKYLAVYNSSSTRWELLNETRVPRGARVTMSVDAAVSHDTVATISWDTESFDTDSIHSTVTASNRLTVPTGVSYVDLTAMITWASSSSGAQRFSEIKKNGTTRVAASRTPPVDASESTMLSGPLAVTGGDYFDVSVYQDSGSSLNLEADGCFFSMTILG